MLPNNFEPFNDYIDIIRKYVFSDYLINIHEKLRWYCIHYLNGSNSYYKNVPNNIYIKPFPDHRFDIIYNVKNLSYTSNNYTYILTDDDINKLLYKIDGSTITRVMISLIFPSSIFLSESIELYAGRKIYPINSTELLEYASTKFCMKYHYMFCVTLIKNNDKNIVIKNTFNDCQCIIPVNIFKIYCKFSNLLEDYDIEEITIPFEFTEKSSNYLQSCLIDGKIQVVPYDFNLIDYKSFKSMFSYLGIELN